MATQGSGVADKGPAHDRQKQVEEKAMVKLCVFSSILYLSIIGIGCSWMGMWDRPPNQGEVLLEEITSGTAASSDAITARGVESLALSNETDFTRDYLSGWFGQDFWDLAFHPEPGKEEPPNASIP